MKTPSKIVCGVAAILCSGILLVLSSTSNSTLTVEDIVHSQTNVTYFNSIASLQSNTSSGGGNGEESSGALPSQSNANWDDLRPLAIELSNYIGKNGHGYTSDPFSSNHSGCTGYDSSIVDKVTITFNNESHTADAYAKHTGLRSDCSGGVSAMLFFMGVTGSGEKIDNMKSTVYKDIGTAVPASTFADVQVGDVIAKTGHVALVVYKDDQKVYTFDWGCTSAINKCKANGYAQEFALNASISEWRSGEIKVRRVK